MPRSASTTTLDVRELGGRERPRRVSGQPLELRRRVAAQPGGVARREHSHLAPGVAQQARAGVPVTPVVPAAADHGDDPVGSDLLDERREPRGGVLHEVQRRHAALVDRPAVRRLRTLGVEQRRRPERKAHAATATAPAVLAVCVSVSSTRGSEVLARAPRQPPRARPTAGPRRRGRPRSPAGAGRRAPAPSSPPPWRRTAPRGAAPVVRAPRRRRARRPRRAAGRARAAVPAPARAARCPADRGRRRA